MTNGYYWYTPTETEKESGIDGYHDFKEAQIVEVSDDLVFLCGSDISYWLAEFKGEFKPVTPA